MNYECVIGLEVHVQINTESKLFCSCPTFFGATPNSQICPICAGYPGVLPVLNKKAVESLIKTALALDCAVNQESIFARKQYFYPDLPKNYQISQYEKPLAENGILIPFSTTGEDKKIKIKRIHLEEDAGKLIHTIGATELDYSLVDLNRTGIPLMEIVSDPDITSAKQAQDYLTTLKMILEYLKVSDCDMEKGSLRCDANISIRPVGTKTLGNRVELKNMNSFRGVHDALVFEMERQIQVLESGGRIVQETRLWDTDRKESESMRSKEEAHDYRYFPEPDLLPLKVTMPWIEEIRDQLPELPHQKRKRFIQTYSLSEYDTMVLTSNPELAEFYEKSVSFLPQKKEAAKLISNWLTTELLGRLNSSNKTISESPINPESLSELVKLILDGVISGKIAKNVFEEMWKEHKKPSHVVKEKGWVQVQDEKEIENWVTLSIAQNPKAVEEFTKGKEKALGALVGAVMKFSKGQANPELVHQILQKKLVKKND
ncbi:MAG: Asp-tRNA(Asn)/Glu-tRNA(Gln) amidotransferase subunit GatB [Elusimicrobia bacterium]|nr:Asp-tRNA(Asn)/Glu-tRNA(Gln) amidotransferase subunit GatB [Elusimicrobiota bacterium]